MYVNIYIYIYMLCDITDPRTKTRNCSWDPNSLIMQGCYKSVIKNVINNGIQRFGLRALICSWGSPTEGDDEDTCSDRPCSHGWLASAAKIVFST